MRYFFRSGTKKKEGPAGQALGGCPSPVPQTGHTAGGVNPEDVCARRAEAAAAAAVKLRSPRTVTGGVGPPEGGSNHRTAVPG